MALFWLQHPARFFELMGPKAFHRRARRATIPIKRSDRGCSTLSVHKCFEHPIVGCGYGSERTIHSMHDRRGNLPSSILKLMTKSISYYLYFLLLP